MHLHPSRRTILRGAVGGAAVASLSSTVPGFLLSTAAQAQANDDDRILVIVQLSGGNDGINTVVPYSDDNYQRNRKVLRIGDNEVHKLNDRIGLHPAMSGLKGLYDEGLLGVVQGVGYPNPNRSHFESMDIWHTAGVYRENESHGGRMTGWLGRYLDANAQRNTRPGNTAGDVGGLHIGYRRQPLALRGEVVAVPSVTNLEGFKLQTEGEATLERSADSLVSATRGSGDDLLGFLHRSSVSALNASQRIESAFGSYSSPVTYPGNALGEQLKGVSQLINAGLGTRVYYVEHEGFDTHSSQQAAHNGLLNQLSESITAFVNDLTHHGQKDRVMLMVFSEFGRRVDENASAGTDHGTAGPMFVVGGGVRAGVIGEHPSLADLDQGDLKYHTDFRRVYAGVLTDWLGLGNTDQILGNRYEPLRVTA